MAQQKTIKFASIVTSNSSNDVVINSFNSTNYPNTESTPADKLNEPSIYKAEVTEEVKTENSIYATEGNLIIAMEDKLINCIIDINGNLLILYEHASKFSINENGELIYSF